MTLIYNLAIVEDRGSYYQVIGTTKNTFDLLSNSSDRHLKLSEVSYKLISDAIAAGKSVRIAKPIKFDEVLPGEVQVNNSADDLSSAKDSAILKIRNLLNFELAKISGFVLYTFNSIHTELLEEGYTITNKNREQKYIEIIETGDIELIEKLEAYLEAKDTLDGAMSMKSRIDKVTEQIKKASSPEEVSNICSQFFSDFYANA